MIYLMYGLNKPDEKVIRNIITDAKKEATLFLNHDSRNLNDNSVLAIIEIVHDKYSQVAQLDQVPQICEQYIFQTELVTKYSECTDILNLLIPLCVYKLTGQEFSQSVKSTLTASTHPIIKRFLYNDFNQHNILTQISSVIKQYAFPIYFTISFSGAYIYYRVQEPKNLKK